MAIVKNVLECFNCGNQISANLEEYQSVKCPACGALNGPGASDNFVDPFYVSEQQRRINDIRKWYNFTLDRDPQKILHSALDFLDSLRVVLHKKMSPEMLKKIVHTGMEIGNLAKSIDEYVKAGGLHVGPEEGKEVVEDGSVAKNNEIY